MVAAALLLAVTAASPATAQATPLLRAEFIGNMAFAITDGKTTLYTDFPYESGYSGYMAYDFGSVNLAPNALCLVTHGHRDHFDAGLFAKMDAKIIAPPKLAATLPPERVITFAPRMTYRDILVEALDTPHRNVDHRSYLVTWRGLRLYFTGDTDSTARLLAMRDLDYAFVSPWLLEMAAAQNGRIDAGTVVVYHQTSDEKVPLIQDRVVLRQGETLPLSQVSAAAAPR